MPYPVSGKVLVDKKPPVGMMVVFHPLENTADNDYKPNGVVDEQGNFTLTTFKNNDGAPAGKYSITLAWIPPRKSIFDEEEEDILRGAYSNQAESKLSFTVQAGPNNIVPVIDLP